MCFETEILKFLPKYPKYFDLSQVQILFSKIMKSDKLDWKSIELSDDLIWIFSNYDFLNLPCHREKIFDGVLFEDWFAYYHHHCSKVTTVCLQINSMYHIIELYDNEWYTVPFRYDVGVGPIKVEDALFIKLFCPYWPQMPIEGAISVEYHPKTNKLISLDGLKNLLSNDTWEFVENLSTIKLMNRDVLNKPTPLKEFVNYYKVLIDSFTAFWNDTPEKLKSSDCLSDDWIWILNNWIWILNNNDDMLAEFDPLDGNFCELT